MESIGTKIKQIRLSKNIKQSDIIKASNISRTKYISIENSDDFGAKNISIEAGIGIAKTLGVPFTELFEIEDSNTISVKLSNEVAENEKEIEKLKNILKDKAIMVEMYQNEKIRISKDIYDFLEETHDLQIHYLNKMDSLLSLQRSEIQNIISSVTNKLAISYFAVTGLILESKLDKIIPKHKGIVRPADPEKEA